MGISFQLGFCLQREEIAFIPHSPIDLQWHSSRRGKKKNSHQTNGDALHGSFLFLGARVDQHQRCALGGHTPRTTADLLWRASWCSRLSSRMRSLSKLRPASMKAGSPPVVRAFSRWLVVVGGSAQPRRGQGGPVGGGRGGWVRPCGPGDGRAVARDQARIGAARHFLPPMTEGSSPSTHTHSFACAHTCACSRSSCYPKHSYKTVVGRVQKAWKEACTATENILKTRHRRQQVELQQQQGEKHCQHVALIKNQR